VGWYSLVEPMSAQSTLIIFIEDCECFEGTVRIFAASSECSQYWILSSRFGSQSRVNHLC